MLEHEHKQAAAAQSQTSSWCHVPQAHESESSTQAPFNPLSQIVPDASVSDEAYQADCYHGPRRDWVSSLLLPPPQDLVDIAIKALNVMSVVGGIAINRYPKIAKRPDNAAMVGQAFGNLTRLRSMGWTADELAAAFENMAGQITTLTNKGWAATRTRSIDGSHIFFGSSGHAFVINPQRQFFRGFRYHEGVREVGGGRWELDYDLLRQLH